MGDVRPSGPTAVAHSRSRGSAVIPYDAAGEAQVAQMLGLAESRGVEVPPGFELDAIQLFYGPELGVDELRLAGFDAEGRPWQAAGRAPLLEWHEAEPSLLDADRGRRHFSAVVLDGDPTMLALLWDVTGMAEEPAPEDDYLVTASSAVYYAVRDLIARAAFVPDPTTPWPRAAIRTRYAEGALTLRPNAPLPAPAEKEATPDRAELDGLERESGEPVSALADRMFGASSALSDFDADVLDVLLDRWIRTARDDRSDVVVRLDEILAARGLAPKRNARGYGAGFHPKQRRQLVESLERLRDLWVDLVETPAYRQQGARTPGPGDDPRPRAVRSRVLLLTDQLGRLEADGRFDVEQVVFRPGRIFGALLAGPGRQVAQLSRKALEYDPYRWPYEKRLARYLAWQWRIRASSGQYLRPYRVETLLGAVGLEIDRRRPSATRERFETLLDRLQADRVVASWQYDGWRETQARGWWRVWLEAKVVLEPPDAIRDAYRSLGQGGHSAHRRSTKRRTAGGESHVGRGPAEGRGALGARLVERRRELGLGQLGLAEAAGVPRARLAAIEAGRRPSKHDRRRLEAWLADPHG